MDAKISPQLAYYYRQKAECLKRSAVWWKAHPEKRRQKDARRRRSAHRQQWLRAYRKRYRINHRDKLNAASRKWQKTPRGRMNYTRGNHRRRARILGLTSDPKAIAEWLREIRTKPFIRCHWCGTKVSSRKIHMDHVIPLSKGGSHTIGNLCAACPDCNCEKRAKSLTDWIARGQTFLSL